VVFTSLFIAVMVQIFVEGCDRVVRFDITEESDQDNDRVQKLIGCISDTFGVPAENFYVTTKGGKRLQQSSNLESFDLAVLTLKFRLCGGIDFQHREGSKIGGGGKASGS
jgi:hypothetical protein